ncbi:MAG TPA: histidine kinase, partial [Streptosporangiaceae bacterium]
MDALDPRITEIRTAIFALHVPVNTARPGTCERILNILQEMTEPLGFTPSLGLAGDLSQVPVE